MPVIRLGVAGLGWLGESLIKDAVRSPSFSVVAVQDVVPDRADDIASRYDVAWSGQSFEELLSRPEVDAVLISTPNHLHAAQAQQALQAGKHVLVQKPLALSAHDARRTVEAAGETGQLLFVDYTYRFLETMHPLREASGRVRSIRAAFHNIYGPGADKPWFFNPATSGGGALIDLGVHLIDLALWLAKPTAVVLEAARLLREAPVEHAAELRLRLDDIPFELDVSWNAELPSTVIFLAIDTDAGTLRWENVDGSFFHFRAARDGQVLVDSETTLREDTLRAFAAALTSPRSAPEVDVRVYEVLDQAYGRA